MRFYNYFLCISIINTALFCYCYDRRQAVRLQNGHSPLAIPDEIKNNKPRTDVNNAPRVIKLSRRGACMSMFGCRPRSRSRSRDSKLMKVPLPNPPLATSPSQSRIAESPFSKIQTPAITRGTTGRSYTIIRANAWKPRPEQPSLRPSDQSSNIRAFLPAASINTTFRSKSVK